MSFLDPLTEDARVDAMVCVIRRTKAAAGANLVTSLLGLALVIAGPESD